MIRRYLLLILTLLSATITQAAAAEVRFDIQSPTTVAAGERFRVEFILSNANGENFKAPTFTGFDILAGPTISSGTQISIINGQQSSLTTYTYTYVLQASSSASKGAISAASVTAGGKTYTTKALPIEIMPGGGGADPNSSPSAAAKSSSLAKDDILLRMEVNHTDVYKGEAIVATLKLYTRAAIAGLENPKYAAFNGFWTQELELPRNTHPQRETIGGKAYESQPIRQWLIYPQRAGALTIEQTTFTAIAQLAIPTSGMSLFDEFFGGGSTVQHINVQLASQPVKINVRELPDPRPSGFSGAVGSFTLEKSISSASVAANSGGSLIVKISGTGDFPLIETPSLSLPAAFEQYDTKTSEQIVNSTKGTTGYKQYEYPFIARAEGEYTIPSIDFSYFDPATKSYRTLSTGEFDVTVTRDNNSSSTSAGAVVSGVTKEDLKMLGQDIRFIRVGESELSTKGKFFVWSLTFIISILAIALAFILLLILLKKQIKERADIIKTKTKKANKVALRRLKRAKGFIAAGQESQFFEEMLRALWGYMGDKLSIEVADLTKERVREELYAKGVSVEQSEEFLDLISECEFAQYSPSAGVQMAKAYNAALDLIGRLEAKV